MNFLRSFLFRFLCKLGNFPQGGTVPKRTQSTKVFVINCGDAFTKSSLDTAKQRLQTQWEQYQVEKERRFFEE
jgi:hypothetical protein